jgi:hypothetical protein
VPREVRYGESIPIEFLVETRSSLSDYTIRVVFYNSSGAIGADGNCDLSDPRTILNVGVNYLRFLVQSLPLKAGRYQIAFHLIDKHGDLIVWAYKSHTLKTTGSHPSAISDCQIEIRDVTVGGSLGDLHRNTAERSSTSIAPRSTADKPDQD